MKNYKVDMVGEFLVNEFFDFWHQFMCYSNNLTSENFFACLDLLVAYYVILSISINMRNRRK